MDMIRDGQRLNYIKNSDGYCGLKGTGVSCPIDGSVLVRRIDVKTAKMR
jgi:hypothetical protein